MKALALDFDQRRLREAEIAEPVIGHPQDVLFRVLEAGVCGTDRALARFAFGRPPEGESMLVLGHEALGEVIATGEGVTDLAPGDLVAPTVRRACTIGCGPCSNGRRDVCRTGMYTERGILGAHGYFAPLAIDRREDLIRIPQSLRDHAVWIEPLSVVEKAVRLALAAVEEPPRNAVVLGAGPVGLLTALALVARGIPVVVHSLESPEKARIQTLVAAGAEYTQGRPPLADIVIEAAGSTQAGFEAVRLLYPSGVAIILGALAGVGEFPFHHLIVGNRKMLGSVNASRQDFLEGLKDLERFPRPALSQWMERRSWSQWPDSLLSDSVEIPKLVHVFGG